MTTYRNAEHAFMGELGYLQAFGSDLQVRGSVTREVTGRSFTIARPLERCIVVPSRFNSLAATIAETMWVLAGRNDLAYLVPYLPRAPEFSDDGKTWRGAYGPRIRDWGGIDQLARVRELLVDEPASRRAVISLFDPAVDFEESLDVPCNNWLHFLKRSDRLDLSIAVRSNDIVWGFSGINSFQWSVLHELMASWTSSAVGQQHWFVSSMHLYERHFARAMSMLAMWGARSVYEESARESPRYGGTWDDFDAVLAAWFEVEALIRGDSDTAGEAIRTFPDPLFRSFLVVLRAHWLRRSQRDHEAEAEGKSIQGTDLGAAVRAAAYEDNPARGATLASHPSRDPFGRLDALRGTIRDLHERKSSAYGDSWKRRGEHVGVLANIARKVDRIENLDAWPAADDESLVDTVIDLYVYLLKYQTFLADQDRDVCASVFGTHAPGPKSDGTAGFEFLLERSVPEPGYVDRASLVKEFAVLHEAAGADESVSKRYRLAEHLSALTLIYLLQVMAAARTDRNPDSSPA